MAASTEDGVESSALHQRLYRFICRCLFDWDSVHWIAAPLLICETLFCAVIVIKARYTKIDWDAYMQEVEGPIVHGEWNYANIRGETGPIAYPAGFVWLYTGLRAAAGGDGSNVRIAQWIFAGVYVFTQAVVFLIYARARPKAMPPVALALLCISKRMHSIYVLRLFNDCWAMLFLYLSLLLFTCHRWRFGCALFSVAVSIKMNIFLFAPALFLLLLKSCGMKGTVGNIALCAAVQGLLALPFLITSPFSYIRGAFGGFGDLQHKWTVNWKFMTPDIFLSKPMFVLVLSCHVGLLGIFAARRWCVAEGGLLAACRELPRRALLPEHIVTLMLTCNFIGVVCSRSLHFQFYCWYWHAMPFLLWQAVRLPVVAKLLVLMAMEFTWSYHLDPVEGTSTPLSSAVLQAAHLVALGSLWLSPPCNAFQVEKDE